MKNLLKLAALYLKVVSLCVITVLAAANQVFAEDYNEITSLEYTISKDIYGELGFSEPYNTQNGWLKFYKPKRVESVDTAMTFQYSAEGLTPSAYFDHTELPIRMLEGKTAQVKITNDTEDVVSPLMVPLAFSSEDLGWVWDDSIPYHEMSEWKWDSNKNDWVEKPFLNDGEFPDLVDVLWLRAEVEVYNNKDVKLDSHLLYEGWLKDYDRESLRTNTPIELSKGWYMKVTFIVTMSSEAGNEYQNLPAVFGMNFELSSRSPNASATPTPTPKSNPDPNPNPNPPVVPPGGVSNPSVTPSVTPAPAEKQPEVTPSPGSKPDEGEDLFTKPIYPPSDGFENLDNYPPDGDPYPGLSKDEMPKTGEISLAVNLVPGLMAAMYGFRLIRRSKK